MKEMSKHVSVEVMRYADPAYARVANGGVTELFTRLELWDKDATDEEIADYCEREAAGDPIDLANLRSKQLRMFYFENPIYTPYAEVVFRDPKYLYMASGNLVRSCDSRFKDVVGRNVDAIRVHDRIETQEEYNLYSM